MRAIIGGYGGTATKSKVQVPRTGNYLAALHKLSLSPRNWRLCKRPGRSARCQRGEGIEGQWKDRSIASTPAVLSWENSEMLVWRLLWVQNESSHLVRHWSLVPRWPIRRKVGSTHKPDLHVLHRHHPHPGLLC